MSHGDEPTGSVPFDLEGLKELIALMEQHGLTEISLQRGDQRWRLRRGGGESASVPPLPVEGSVHSAPPPLPISARSAEAGSRAKETETDNLVEIKSPTVGTFYAAPSPDDPPFVTIGSKVESDTVVCLVEAMKVFNQIPAEVSGTIVKILVKSGDPVEYGQPLFKVRPG